MFAHIAHNHILLDNIKFWDVARLKSFNPFDDIPKGTTSLFHVLSQKCNFFAFNSIRILLCLSFAIKAGKRNSYNAFAIPFISHISNTEKSMTKITQKDIPYWIRIHDGQWKSQLCRNCLIFFLKYKNIFN